VIKCGSSIVLTVIATASHVRRALLKEEEEKDIK